MRVAETKMSFAAYGIPSRTPCAGVIASLSKAANAFSRGSSRRAKSPALAESRACFAASSSFQLGNRKAIMSVAFDRYYRAHIVVAPVSLAASLDYPRSHALRPCLFWDITLPLCDRRSLRCGARPGADRQD